jgi:hypothetical protein
MVGVRYRCRAKAFRKRLLRRLDGRLRCAKLLNNSPAKLIRTCLALAHRRFIVPESDRHPFPRFAIDEHHRATQTISRRAGTALSRKSAMPWSTRSDGPLMIVTRACIAPSAREPDAADDRTLGWWTPRVSGARRPQRADPGVSTRFAVAPRVRYAAYLAMASEEGRRVCSHARLHQRPCPPPESRGLSFDVSNALPCNDARASSRCMCQASAAIIRREGVERLPRHVAGDESRRRRIHRRVAPSRLIGGAAVKRALRPTRRHLRPLDPR